MPFFEALVDHFYDAVQADPVLLRLYPSPDDLSGARRRAEPGFARREPDAGQGSE